MSLAVVRSRAGAGVAAPEVTVEVHLSGGLPSLSIVGLPETAVKESKDRVRSALLNSRHEFPRRRITINLAPADLPKEGGRFDLPIAIGILAASGQIAHEELECLELYGELSLDGKVRPIGGLLPAALAAGRSGRTIAVPAANAPEAALARQTEVLPVDHLLTLCAHLQGEERLTPQTDPLPDACPAASPNLADVRGQVQARRALEIAAAGGHSLLMVGPPGTGKSMLAARLPGILPPMTETEAAESAAVLSIADGGFDPAKWAQRPFRNPHHTASGVALVGGGSQPRPGEISLAHHGVLFLDELPEFDRKVLEVLREPLETGRITISRAARQADYPARFQLVAAMNPCPCGHLGDPRGHCRCTEDQVARYRNRLSGPLLDRIDLHVEVPPVPLEELGADRAGGEPSAPVRNRVVAARERQQTRGVTANALLAGDTLDTACQTTAAGQALLQQAGRQLDVSARAFHRILRIARTIADLEGADTVDTPHLTEALGFRGFTPDTTA